MIKNRQRLFFGISLVVLFIVLAGCAPCCWFVPPGFPDNLDLTTGSVKGSAYVVTNEGKEPIGKLSVTIGGKTVTSDYDGTFEVTGLKPGTYDIRVSGGDLGYAGKVTVTAGSTTDMGELPLQGTLPPPSGGSQDSTTDT